MQNISSKSSIDHANAASDKTPSDNGPSEVQIAQYIATKLCHDLAGSIGAVSSGVDFLDSNDLGTRTSAIELIKTSSHQTVSRLVFFRYTYGDAKYVGEANLEEIKRIAIDYINNTKIKIDFPEKYFRIDGVFVSADIGKLLLCLVHHSMINLIYGGEIKIEIERANDKSKILVKAIGPSPKVDEERASIINDEGSGIAISPKNCISFFASKFAKEVGAELSAGKVDESTILYQIHF